ncbi:MAG TPA: SPOR domain-containing protein [Moraxellaceae bacterium]|nr:SPOR domain-containing protein [Moraxellaceae bacterium]
MMHLKGWPWLAVSAGSAAVLGVLVVGLVVHGRETPGAPELTVEDVSAGTTFAPGFGRLDDLVPFSGGVAPVPEVVVPEAHATGFRDADWVKAQNPESYTLQVMAARDEEAVKHFLADREDRGEFSYFVYPQDGSNWFVVTVGNFPTRELAEGVAASKDWGTGGGRAFSRRFGVYQDALKSASVPAPTPASPPVPAPAAEPAAPSTAPH